jgi:1-acyl-sn-glycerol-3-phosphate acyltransferase
VTRTGASDDIYDRWWRKPFYIIARAFCLLAFRILYRARMEGRRRLPKDGPVVVVANHQSYYDPILIGLLLRYRPFRTVARIGLFGSKRFSFLIRVLGAIPIDQDKSDTAAMRTAIAQISRGCVLVLFPEGSRTSDGHVAPLMRGMTLILKRTRATVVPAAIEGAFDVWPHFNRRPRLTGRMRIRALEPIPYDDLMADGADAALDRLRQILEDARLALRTDIRRRTRGRYPRDRQADRPFVSAPDHAQRPADAAADR